MPRKRKRKPILPKRSAQRLTELPDEEAVPKLLGKRLARVAKEAAHAKDDPED